MGVACQTAIERSVGHIDEGVEHRHTYISNVRVDELHGVGLVGHAVPEAEYGQHDEGQTGHDEIRAVLAQPGVVLVHKGAHEGVPQDVDESDHEKHGGCMCGLESEDVGVEEQQIHADGLVDEILGQIARSESDTR